MGLFVCDKCKILENTTNGNYWSRNENQKSFGEEYPDGEAYCSVCIPSHYKDGSKVSCKKEKYTKYHKKATVSEVIRLFEDRSLCMTKTAADIITSVPKYAHLKEE